MRKRDERGIAMITVLFIGAGLTVLSSTAAFVAIEEFGATRADRSAAQALAYAEAGVDRLLLKIRSNDYTWNNISLAGCDADHPVVEISGSISLGTYRTTLEVYDDDALAVADRFRPTACAGASASIGADDVRTFLISSTGEQPDARRLVREVVEIEPLGLPIGVYAYDRVDANGNVQMENISMVSEKSVYNRDNLEFRGTDPYYTLGQFYPGLLDVVSAAKQMPAAVHAKVALYYGPASKLTEHRDPRDTFEPNCDANADTVGQSLWDGSGTAVLDLITRDCPAWLGSGYIDEDGDEGAFVTGTTYQPPTSRFTEEHRRSVAPTPTLSEQDYLTLRTAAKQTGLYCSGSGLVVPLTCTEAGGASFSLGAAGQLDSTHIDGITSRSFVVYIDFDNDGTDPFAREVIWTGSGDIGPCSTNPANSRSAVLVVRRGSIRMSGGAEINGAMLVPEGVTRSTGGFTLEGTLITRRIEVQGSATIRLSTCWLANLPGPFLNLRSTSWTEVDR